MTHFWTTGDAITMRLNQSGLPHSFTWRGTRHNVLEIARRWRVDDGWWWQRTWRDYYKLTTTSGLLIVIYHDRLADRWFVQRLYD